MNPMIMLLKNKIKVFKTDITDFCINNNIEVSLYNFLSFKEKEKRLPKNINRMLALRMPKLYVVSSKEFWKALEDIPYDFRKDIVMQMKTDKIKIFLSENFEVVDFLRGIHGINYYNILKKGKKNDNKSFK